MAKHLHHVGSAHKRRRSNAKPSPPAPGQKPLPAQNYKQRNRADRQAPVAPQLIEQPLVSFTKEAVEARVNEQLSKITNRMS